MRLEGSAGTVTNEKERRWEMASEGLSSYWNVRRKPGTRKTFFRGESVIPAGSEYGLDSQRVLRSKEKGESA